MNFSDSGSTIFHMISAKESCGVESHYSLSKTIHKNENNCTRKTPCTPSPQVSRLENN